MNTKNIVLSLVAAVGLLATASAQVTITGDYNDLFLGFRKDGSNDVVVDLGSLSLFTAAGTGSYYSPGNAVSISRLSTADLSAVYTSNWNSTNAASWGVVGATVDGLNTTSAPNNALWVSSGNASFTPRSSDDQYSAAANILGMASGVINATSTANSNFTAIMASTDNGYTYNITATTGALWNVFTSANKLENTTAGISTMELFQLNPGAAHGIDLGTLTLSSSGLTFTAIPEPSTYAMILGVFALGFVMLRRRAHASV